MYTKILQKKMTNLIIQLLNKMWVKVSYIELIECEMV